VRNKRHVCSTLLLFLLFLPFKDMPGQFQSAQYTSHCTASPLRVLAAQHVHHVLAVVRQPCIHVHVRQVVTRQAVAEPVNALGV